jgi:hypothetical protein
MQANATDVLGLHSMRGEGDNIDGDGDALPYTANELHPSCPLGSNRISANDSVAPRTNITFVVDHQGVSSLVVS